VVNEYKTDDLPIFHFDLYCIEDADELYAIGFEDYLARDGFCLCEWSENGEGELPDGRISVTIARMAENEDFRRILIEGVEL
jgi:tRNA threonylcarbamoyladenosine biosynthesis protein TsaE